MFKCTYDGLKDLLNRYFTDPGRDFYVALLSGGDALSESSTIADVLALELLTTDGYARQPITFASAGVDGVQKAIRFPEIEVEFTASDETVPLLFDSIALIADGKATANKTASSIAGSPSTITIASHGLVAGDRLIFTNVASSAPADLTLNQSYYVLPSGLTTNEFRVAAAPGGTALTFGTTWSGDLVCRYVTGVINSFELRPDNGSGSRTQTINPGQTHVVPFQMGVRGQASSG